MLLLTPFHWASLRFYLLPIFTFILAWLLCARYLQDIYNLPSLKACLRNLFACLFGMGYPTLTIAAAEENEKPVDSSYLPDIGGPGYLEIRSGYAVAVSSPQATSNIYGEGLHFLQRGEKVEEIADLNDQTDRIEAVSAFTHEGVAIRLSDIHFGYRLKTTPAIDAKSREKATKPYLFSTHALRYLLQSRVVTEQGLTDWRMMVKGMIRSTISDFIYQHTVRELLKPPADYNPYADLKKLFQSRAFRERLRKMGTELLWINLGLFDLEKEAYKQALLETWQPQTALPQTISEPSRGDNFPDQDETNLARFQLIEELLQRLDQNPAGEDPLKTIRYYLRSISHPTNPSVSDQE